MKRSAGLKRSGFKNPRKPMARGTKAMKRGKAPGPGKKKLAKDAATRAALLSYFERFGWEDEPGTRKAPCQAGSGVTKEDLKKPGARPELLKKDREKTPPALAEWLVDLARRTRKPTKKQGKGNG